MPRFSLKDILRGTTLAALGLGMLAVAFEANLRPTSKALKLQQDLLVAFGGMLVGYALAFPLKYPPHRMILAMIGMFAAQAWRSGSSLGLLVYLGLLASLGCLHLFQLRRAKRRNQKQ
jgi:hypothetical protein